MSIPPTDETPQRSAAWAWGVALLVMGAHFAAAYGLLRVSLGPSVDPMTAALFAAVLPGAGLIVGVLFGQPVWATVLCALGSLSGWLFGACGLGMLELTDSIFRTGMFCCLAGGAVFGALLGLWALDHPVSRMEAVALTCLSGFPVLASQFLGCLIGTWAAVLGPTVLSVAMAARIVWDRVRLRRQMRPVLWPVDAEPPALPDWYARPAWASAFGPAHYALTAAFAAIQVLILGLLLDRSWLGASGIGRKLLAPGKLHWLFLAGVATIWAVVWIFLYPFRHRGRRELPNAAETVAKPPYLPSRASQDAGWSLITLAVLFALSTEFVVFLQRTHQPFAQTPALLGLLLIATILMAAIVLIAAWILPLIGRVRFSLFSLLYALAVLAALAGGLFALWTQALAEG